MEQDEDLRTKIPFSEKQSFSDHFFALPQRPRQYHWGISPLRCTAVGLLRQCVAHSHLFRSRDMAKAKTPRITKPRTSKKILQMPDNGVNGNGFAAVDLEPEIRLRAYELYEQRGCIPGHDAEDWFAAEREILERHAQQTQTA
jgi:Protein of unknown function (DUF2934)